MLWASAGFFRQGESSRSIIVSGSPFCFIVYTEILNSASSCLDFVLPKKHYTYFFCYGKRRAYILYDKTSSVFCNLSTKASQLPLCVSDEKRCFVAGVFQNARSQALPKLVLPWQAAK